MNSQEKEALIIAIDGFSGTGKSTIAREVARKLGWFFLDTGFMYRSLAGLLRSERIQEGDYEVFCQKVDFGFHDKECVVQNYDVKTNIRHLSLSKFLSSITQNEKIRHEMVKKQRQLSQNKNVVVEGRDITTVVFPYAPYRYFFTAQLEVRAQRRYLELKNKGMSVSLSDIVLDLETRDRRDTERAIAPLKKGDGVMEMDTSDMTIDGVVLKIISLIQEV